VRCLKVVEKGVISEEKGVISEDLQAETTEITTALNFDLDHRSSELHHHPQPSTINWNQ
jgi:hypothetical protein